MCNLYSVSYNFHSDQVLACDAYVCTDWMNIIVFYKHGKLNGQERFLQVGACGQLTLCHKTPYQNTAAEKISSKLVSVC